LSLKIHPNIRERGISTTGRDAMDRVIAMGILGQLDAYSKMVQFRNFVVHRYEQVDNAILVDMVNRRLVDFESFRNEILAYLKRTLHED
jgi:uncharacterized protein YutE (UPF0331/DUF86 family)